ncbi:helix-turn-helix domain-containing protein [Micromonospora sp. NPDC023888]|uniref:TetR/AcrR family transcriptional regulator n=1 Tax=Micromonospora sp. NPDC023888 TaxID=3155607 RepID=UPI0033DFFE41
MAQQGPLGYEPDKVLDVAMRLFWDHRYEGTSMSDLTEAMGINRRAAYGSKESPCSRPPWPATSTVRARSLRQPDI